jgi:hypothetical protein
MMKALEDIKSAGLKQIAKAIKLPGYSGLNTQELRKELAVALKKNKDFDITPYLPTTPKEEEVTEEKEVTRKETVVSKGQVAFAPRRSVIGRKFGRR